jgi:8-oxo-dGTP diphosphatase
MERVSARAIVITNDRKVILIHRIRNDREYWVTPGGGLEGDETYVEAVKRELKEEVGIDVDVHDVAFDISSKIDGIKSIQKFFWCTYASGKIGSGTGSEIQRSTPSDLHEVVLVDYAHAKKMNIVPREVKKMILSKLAPTRLHNQKHCHGRTQVRLLHGIG